MPLRCPPLLPQTPLTHVYLVCLLNWTPQTPTCHATLLPWTPPHPCADGTATVIRDWHGCLVPIRVLGRVYLIGVRYVSLHLFIAPTPSMATGEFFFVCFIFFFFCQLPLFAAAQSPRNMATLSLEAHQAPLPTATANTHTCISRCTSGGQGVK